MRGSGGRRACEACGKPMMAMRAHALPAGQEEAAREPMMLGMRPRARFCSDACRQKARRARRGLKAEKDSSNEQGAEEKQHQ